MALAVWSSGCWSASCWAASRVRYWSISLLVVSLSQPSVSASDGCDCFGGCGAAVVDFEVDAHASCEHVFEVQCAFVCGGVDRFGGEVAVGAVCGSASTGRSRISSRMSLVSDP